MSESQQDPDPIPPAEMTDEARRQRRILIVCMSVMVLLPLVLATLHLLGYL